MSQDSKSAREQALGGGRALFSLTARPLPSSLSPSRLLTGVKIGLVALLAIVAADFVFALLTPLPKPLAETPALDAEGEVDLSIFARYDPFFGQPDPPLPEAPAPVTEETSLDLILFGTFVGPNASAIIGPNPQTQKLIRPEEEVARGTVLEEVHTTYVVLRRDGRRETLTLENRERREAYRDAPPPPQPPSSVRRATGQEVVTNFTPEEAEAFGDFSTFLRLRPDPDGRGIRLYAGEQPQLFQEFELQDGDLLVAINNRPASDMRILSTLPDAMLQNGGVTITVERNGQPVSLTLDPASLIQ